MEGLKNLIKQQDEYETYKTKKSQQLADHVDHLKYIVTTKLLELCEDWDHSISEPNTLIFNYKELSISIQIINPITETRKEKEYNLSQRVSERLKMVINVSKKQGSKDFSYTIEDKTQYKKDGPYIYEIDTQAGPERSEDFLYLLDRCFSHIHNLKVDFISNSVF